MEEVKAVKRQVNQPFEQDKGQQNKNGGKENQLLKLWFQNYTPLNTSLQKIMDDVKTVELLNPPKRNNSTIKLLNAEKHCDMHFIVTIYW